jgi:hypothetical protein
MTRSPAVPPSAVAAVEAPVLVTGGGLPPGRSRCSYCPADMGPSGTRGDSHGICPRCWALVRSRLGLQPKPYPVPRTAQQWAVDAIVHHGAQGCDPCALEADSVR